MVVRSVLYNRWVNVFDGAPPPPPPPPVNLLLFDFENAADSDYPGYLDGHKGVVGEPDVSFYSGLSFDNADASSDVEVLVRLHVYDHYTTGDRIGVFVRGAGTGSDYEGYWFLIRPDDVKLYELSSGSFTTLGILSADGDNLYANTWFWLRLRANGTTISAKYWRDGETEPGSWQLSATDATYASGWAGWQGRRCYHYCDFFSCDTNGGTAPSPGDTPGADQYIEDFSTQADAASPPSGFTERWQAWDTTPTISEEDSDIVLPREFQRGWSYEEAYGSRRGGSVGSYLELENRSTHRTIVYYKDATFTDCEVLMKVRRNESGTVANNEFRIYLRANGDTYGTSENSYHFDFSNGNIILSKYVAGSSSGINTSTGLTFANNTFYWVRFEVTGTTVRFKVWTGAKGDEPGSWDVSETDSDHAGPGHVGFGNFRALRNWEVHYFEIIDND